MPRWQQYQASCTLHWKRMTQQEQRALAQILWRIGCAALDGDQQERDAACDEAHAMLERLGPELYARNGVPPASV
jgi:hypothetical protein